MFVDHIRIYAQAGDGGNGSAHFRREKYEPKGGPDGGDGGRGGDIVLEVSPHTDNLKNFFYQSQIKAVHGGHGSRNLRTGKSGKSLVLQVPPGTLVYASPDDPQEDEEEKLRSELVGDLTTIGQRFILCTGGKGGKGNVHFKSSTNRTPEETTEGDPGERGYYYLELQQIADAGLVGFPNAGKSTLLGALSSAHPKVASYPFTTLQPSVGVIEFPGFSRATMADIPGLIEGAHENVGLGHDFLRHIMRCHLLLFVLDMAGTDGRDPIADLETLRKEVRLHDENLAGYPWIILANKMDVEGTDEMLNRLQTRFSKQEIIPISAEAGLGLEALKDRLHELIAHRPE